MTLYLTTERLDLQPLNLNDVAFIYELLNTEEWIEFIGDRHIKTNNDAINYIQKLLDNANIQYWVVRLKTNNESIGIVTFVKRDYLPYADLGFAFLKRFTQQGYAFEAANEVLQNIINSKTATKILATTVVNNVLSIQLLEKLGFTFDENIQEDNVTLNVYAKDISMETQVLSIEKRS